MTAPIFSLIFLLALSISLVVRIWLARRQVAHVISNRDHVPSAFASRVSPEAHRKAADYTVAKQRLASWNTLVDAAFLLAMTLGGGLAAIVRLDADAAVVCALA